MSRINFTLFGALLTVGLGFSGVTQAALTAKTSNGVNLVYDSGANITWTADANLLGTMEASAIAQYGNDTSLINSIIAASGGVIHDTSNMFDTPANSGVHNLSASDFGNAGAVDWFGAQAFAAYQNKINYGNSNQWSLPATNNPASGTGLLDSSLFINVQPVIASVWWTANESALPFLPFPEYALWFSSNGSAGISYKDQSYDSLYVVQFLAWTFSPGDISATIAPVPLPGAVWLFGVGLGLLVLKTNRKHRSV